MCAGVLIYAALAHPPTDAENAKKAGLTRTLREDSVTRGTDPCAKWPHGVLPEERRYRHIVAQGKTSTAAGCTGLGLIVASLTQYPG